MTEYDGGDITNSFNRASPGAASTRALFDPVRDGNRFQVMQVLRDHPDAITWRDRSDDDKTALILAAEHDHADILQQLIDAGANLEAHSSKGSTALMLAAFNGNDNSVDILLDHGADADAVNGNGVTVLMAASWSGSKKTLDRVLEAGVDVDAVDNTGMSALLYAAQNGHQPLVRALAEAGADLAVVSEEGMDLAGAAEASGDAQMMVLAERLKKLPALPKNDRPAKTETSKPATKKKKKKDKDGKAKDKAEEPATEQPAAQQPDKSLKDMVEDMRADAKKAAEQINNPKPDPKLGSSDALKDLNRRLKDAGFGKW